MLVAAGEGRPAGAGLSHEALLDQRQQGGVVAFHVRDIVGLGEGRDDDQGNADAELVEALAFGRIGTGRVGGEGRTQGLGVLDAGVGGAERIDRALRPAARLGAGRRI